MTTNNTITTINTNAITSMLMELASQQLNQAAYKEIIKGMVENHYARQCEYADDIAELTALKAITFIWIDKVATVNVTKHNNRYTLEIWDDKEICKHYHFGKDFTMIRTAFSQLMNLIEENYLNGQTALEALPAWECESGAYASAIVEYGNAVLGISFGKFHVKNYKVEIVENQNLLGIELDTPEFEEPEFVDDLEEVEEEIDEEMAKSILDDEERNKIETYFENVLEEHEHLGKHERIVYDAYANILDISVSEGRTYDGKFVVTFADGIGSPTNIYVASAEEAKTRFYPRRIYNIFIKPYMRKYLLNSTEIVAMLEHGGADIFSIFSGTHDLLVYGEKDGTYDNAARVATENGAEHLLNEPGTLFYGGYIVADGTVL